MTDQRVRQLRADTRTEAAEVPATLFEALARFQADLPRILKGNTAKVPGKDGKQGYTYDYADLADVSDAVLKGIGAYGLVFTAWPGHREDGKFGLEYTLGHVSGERRDGWWELRSDLPMQQMGGMITYARRYSLLAVTGAHPAGEDDDAASSQHVASRPSAGDAWEIASPARSQRPDTALAARLLKQAGRVRDADDADSVACETRDARIEGLLSKDDADHIQNRLSVRLQTLRKSEPDPTRPAAPAATSPATDSSTAPDADGHSEPDYDTPGTATTPQIGAIWTVLSTVFKFGKDEKDQARAVCSYITQHALGSTKDMTRNEAKAVLDTLSSWRETAEQHGEQPREFLIELMAGTGTGGGGE